MRIICTAVMFAALSGAVAAPLAAQQPTPTDVQPMAGPQARPKLGVGFQSSWPAYGLSGVYDVNSKVSAQAVVGLFGGWTTLSGRALYHFAPQPSIDPYGYGMVGIWRYSLANANASAASFGGGAGFDWDLRKVAPDLPPLYLNLELGLSIVDLELAGYTGAMMAFGAGFHYRF
ncbi:hypothetical protein BH23GEM9_BH23GEM9_12320 [soil metagenome]